MNPIHQRLTAATLALARASGISGKKLREVSEILNIWIELVEADEV